MKIANEQELTNMAKAISLTAADLKPEQPNTQSAVGGRGSVPSSQLVPLQFRMPPEFVRAFKQAALDRDMKLNELLNLCFAEFVRAGSPLMERTQADDFMKEDK
jgi:hypothetical protein